jgi:hypothetical protein
MYSAADCVEMLIIIFGECGRNAREAARVFSDRFPDRPSPDHKAILRDTCFQNFRVHLFFAVLNQGCN